jgi:hypothetical protein
MAPESTSGLKTVDAFISWLWKGASRLEIVLTIPERQYMGEVISLNTVTLIDCIKNSKPITVHKSVNDILVASSIIINSDNVMNFQFSYL